MWHDALAWAALLLLYMNIKPWIIKLPAAIMFSYFLVKWFLKRRELADRYYHLRFPKDSRGK